MAFGIFILCFDRTLVKASLNPYLFKAETLHELWNADTARPWHELMSLQSEGNSGRARVKECLGVLAKASIRFVIALATSFIFAETALFFIFSSEISQRAASIEGQIQQQQITQLNQEYAKQHKNLVGELSSEEGADDPVIKRLTGQLSTLSGQIGTAETTTSDLDRLQAAELDGTHLKLTLPSGETIKTTGVPGKAGTYYALHGLYVSAKDNLGQLQATQASAQKQLAKRRKRILNSSSKSVSDIEGKIRALNAKHAAQLSAITNGIGVIKGLLIRQEALSQLEQDANPETARLDSPHPCTGGPGGIVCDFERLLIPPTPLGAYVLAFRVFFLAVELAPITLKIAMSLRRRRPYDTFEAAAEERALAASMLSIRDSRERMETESQERHEEELLLRESSSAERLTASARLNADHEVSRYEIELNKRREIEDLESLYGLEMDADGLGPSRSDTAEQQPPAEARGPLAGDQAPAAEARGTGRHRADAVRGRRARASTAGGDEANYLSTPVRALMTAATARFTQEGLVINNSWKLLRAMEGAESGGGASIWIGHHVKDEAANEVVVKTIPAALDQKLPGRDDYIKARGWKREAASQVTSDYVGQILDSGTDRAHNLYYLVSPRYTPGSLARYCEHEGRGRTLGWCFKVTEQILLGLADAGKVGLIHLDIKPGNIVLDGDNVRIIDWGLARTWQKHASYTGVGFMRGTLFYASPEQLARNPEDWDTPFADLYAVGALFYWLVTGEAPLSRKLGPTADFYDCLKAFEGGVRPPQAQTLADNVPSEVGALIDAWLSYDREDRVPPGTAAEDAITTALAWLRSLRAQLGERADVRVGEATGRHTAQAGNAVTPGLESEATPTDQPASADVVPAESAALSGGEAPVADDALTEPAAADAEEEPAGQAVAEGRPGEPGETREASEPQGTAPDETAQGPEPEAAQLEAVSGDSGGGQVIGLDPSRRRK
jgi:hypothetical protein